MWHMKPVLRDLVYSREYGTDHARAMKMWMLRGIEEIDDPVDLIVRFNPANKDSHANVAMRLMSDRKTSTEWMQEIRDVLDLVVKRIQCEYESEEA
jgi:hypothetical protein